MNLTENQRAQIRAIRTRYRAQYKASRDQYKPLMEAARKARQSGDTAAARADFAKIRSQMQASTPARQREMTEIRSILTADQQARFDAHQKAMAGWKANGRRGGWHGRRGFQRGNPGLRGE